MDFSKAFNSIPHDLLIAKMCDCSFSKNSLVFFYLYLKRKKQNVRINNTHFSNLAFWGTSRIYTRTDLIQHIYK